MTTIVKSDVVRQDGEFAPMVTAEIRDALRLLSHGTDALFIYTEAMAKPDGWNWGNRERIARELGWTLHRVKRSISALVAVGLYVVETTQNAVGRWFTKCEIVTTPGASPQVTPESDIPGVGDPASIPSPTEKRKERGGGFLARHARLSKRAKHGPPHSDTDCPRDKEGLPCRECGKLRTAREAAEKRAAATDSVTRPYAASVAAVLNRAECEHGNPVGLTSEERPLCPKCRRRQ